MTTSALRHDRCIAFLLLSAIAGHVSAQEPLRIATYNVENLFDNHDDPYHDDEGTSPKSFAERRALVRMIDELDADVLAVQEVENRGVLEALNRHLAKPYPIVELIEGNDRRGIDCGLMSRVPLDRTISHRLRRLQGGGRFSRDLPVFELRPGGSRPLFVCPVHFKSKLSSRGDPGGAIKRKAETDEVIGVLDEIRSVGIAAPLVLLGDFNDVRDSKPLAGLFERFSDATSSVPLDERYSYTYRGTNQQIDHVLIDGDLAVAKARFVRRKDNPSDHTPIVVDVSWPTRVRRQAGPRHVEFVEPHVPIVDATDTRRLRSLLLQEVEVHGTITAVRATRSGGHKNVHFGTKSGGRPTLVLFVHRRVIAKFPDIDAWVGKQVKVRGPVFDYRGTLEIQLRSRDQVELVR